MMINKNSFLLILVLMVFSNLLSGQNKITNNGFYKKEMKSLQAAIQEKFYDKPSGYYFVVTDSAKREKKGDYLREYTYIWSLCAIYQAANEIEKLEPHANLMDPLLNLLKFLFAIVRFNSLGFGPSTNIHSC